MLFPSLHQSPRMLPQERLHTLTLSAKVIMLYPLSSFFAPVAVHAVYQCRLDRKAALKAVPLHDVPIL